ncbi:MAG: ABC transporter permease [Actinomyces sp.]|nr:ABC transporter permease [Actinomyces sp.]
MTRLIVSDLRVHVSTWVWTFMVAVTCAAALAAQLRVMHGSLASARAAGNADMVEAAGTLAGWVIATVVLTALPVLASTVTQALELRRRDLGLWRALGMRPGLVVTVVGVQLTLLGGLGGLLGVGLGVPLSRLVMHLMVTDQAALPGTVSAAGAADLPVVIGSTAAVCLTGGLRSAWRTSRTPEALLLRGQSAPSRLGRWLGIMCRLGMVAALTAALVATVLAVPQDQESAVNQAVGGAFASLAMVIVLTPWVAPLLQHFAGWVVAGGGPAWFLATRTCSVESRRSSATVLPFTIAIGLVGTLFAMKTVGASGVTSQGFVAMFGPCLLVAWVGGIGIIAMAAGRRRHDAALLVAAGARLGQVRLTEISEGIIHTATAALLGLAATVASLACLDTVLDLGTPDLLRNGPWTQVGVAVGATLLVCCVTIALSTRGGTGASLTSELRTAE